MSILLATAHLKGPHVDFAALSPLIALFGGAIVVLLVGLLGSRWVREQLVPALALVALGAALGLTVWRWNTPESVVSGALRIDRLSLTLNMILAVGGIAAVLLAWRSEAAREAAHGELHAMLLTSIGGMAMLGAAQNTVTLFLAIELLSIPLYVLCASEIRREGSLEAGLKYLVIGSVGSATLVYGLAMIYGATGSTQFGSIAAAIAGGLGHGRGLLGDPLLLTGTGLVIVGFAFKASVAPFHQWTPDVYEGAPTPITGFMATATKAAALGVLLRFFDVAALPIHVTWSPALAVIAAITIVTGNVGALTQSSLKRMLGYSGVAQAGYMLAGVVVATNLGVNATVLYLLFYLMMNMAAFAVIVALQNERADGDDMAALAGLGRRDPWLAWSMTIAMLGLAGIPGTVGFIGKFQLIHALVNGAYTWLAIVLVVGSMISLGYYLRVVAAIWMRGEVPAPGPAYADLSLNRPGGLAPIAGGSPEADQETVAPVTAAHARFTEVTFVAAACAAASVGFGVFPTPLFHLAAHAGRALTGLL
ncbi:MAG: NADH-quinone oxidoreductase subunit N [Solirubrobacteraceae bacterium]